MGKKINTRKKLLKSRKRREQTIAIVIVAVVILLVTAGMLIFALSRNENFGKHEHEYKYEAKITLQLGSGYREGEVHYQAIEAFKKEVEKRTEGVVRVEIITSKESNETLIQQIVKKENEVDIVVADVADFTVADARMDISSLPFLFDGYESAWKFMENDIQKEIETDLHQKNLRVLAHYAGEFEFMTSTKEPISNASKLQNMSFAMSEENYSAIAVRAMNAKAVVLESNAVVQALKSGQCDGYIGTIPAIYTNQIYHSQKYMSMTYNSYHAMAFAISEEAWKMLSEEEQKIVQGAATNSANTDRTLVRQQEDSMLKQMESAGVQVIRPKLTGFHEGAKMVIRGYREKYGKFVDKLLIFLE